MPAVSKSQRRLMGQAYAYKKGELTKADIDDRYEDEIIKLANTMSTKDLKKYAKTKEKGLPAKKKESTTNESYIKRLAKDIMTEAKGHEFEAKGSIVAVDGAEDKEQAKAIAVEFLKFLKKDSSLSDQEGIHITIDLAAGGEQEQQPAKPEDKEREQGDEGEDESDKGKEKEGDEDGDEDNDDNEKE